LTFGTLLLILAAALIVFINSDAPRWYVAAGVMVFAVVLPPLFDPFTRTFWTAIDISMRPLEAFEVDWAIVDPGSVESSGSERGNTNTEDALPSVDRPADEDQ
jgi:hypothetical protein